MPDPRHGASPATLAPHERVQYVLVRGAHAWAKTGVVSASGKMRWIQILDSDPALPHRTRREASHLRELYYGRAIEIADDEQQVARAANEDPLLPSTWGY